MKNRARGLFAIALVGLLTVPAAGQVDTGSADFSVDVHIGDSLGSGFMSGGLHVEGQSKSFPLLLDLQVNGAGSTFEQPLVTAPGIPGVLRLESLAPLVLAPQPGQGAPANLDLPRPYNNLAVPGARVGDLVRTRTGGLHDLVLRGLGTQLELAAALGPTFVSIWIGNNDVLRAATSGMVLDGVTLTRTADFDADLRAIVGTLSAVGVQSWAIATIPAVTALPFVSTLPPVLVDPATGQPVLVNGAPVPLIGPDGLLGAGDKVLLTASELLAQGIGIPTVLGGSGRPLPDGAVLSSSEVAAIEARRAEINAVIRAVANEGGGALVDAAGLFDEVVQRGLLVGGITLTTDFLTGGLFTYDGVHPSPISHAVVANAYIDAINAQYGGSIRPVALAPFLLTDLGRYPGVGGGAAAAAGGEVVFSSRAYRNLRRALGVPSPRKLERIKRRLARRAAARAVRTSAAFGR